MILLRSHTDSTTNGKRRPVLRKATEGKQAAACLRAAPHRQALRKSRCRGSKSQTPETGAREARRAGQTLIFLLALVVILALVILWNFDLHRVLSVKVRSQNAGDAAALAAARWQGVSLNMIGHLNVIQAVSVSNALIRGDTEFPEAEALADLRARIAFTGPMTGLAAAQQAARQNGLFNRDSYTRIVQRHAARVRSQYAIRFPEPYRNFPSPPTAWDDYAGMIEAIAQEGVAALPDNAQFYADYRHRDHLLLNPDFYDAIASADWCWFHYNARSWLYEYGSWRDWNALPEYEEQDPANAEFFSLGVQRIRPLELIWEVSPEDGPALLARLTGRSLPPDLAQAPVDWTGYHPRVRSAWSDALPERFPFLSDIRPEADAVGADAAVRTEAVTRRVSPGGASDIIQWSAAAKAFGGLNGNPPQQYGLVLPAFREVRLIPVDASTAQAAGSRPGWFEHIYEHLSPYIRHGPERLHTGCWYCQQLLLWEEPDFRESGQEWLDRFSHTCLPTPGTGPGGGSRRGH